MESPEAQRVGPPCRRDAHFSGHLTDETEPRPALFEVEGEKAWLPFVYNFRFCLPRSRAREECLSKSAGFVDSTI